MNFKIIIAIMFFLQCFFEEMAPLNIMRSWRWNFSQSRYVKIYHLVAITVAVKKKEIKRNLFYVRLNFVLLCKLRVND